MKNLLAIISLLLIISCAKKSSTKDDDEVDILLGKNNYSTLSGTAIGSNSRANSSLSKYVSISGTSTKKFIAFSPIITTIDTGAFKWIIPVMSNEKEPQCYIQMTSIRFRDDSYNEIDSTSRTYVLGSLGELSHIFYTNTCLVNGEIGYFYGIQRKNHNDVSTIRYSNITSRDKYITDPHIEIKPTSYYTSGAYKNPIIRIKNSSDYNVKLGFSTVVFILNSYDSPINYRYISIGKDKTLNSGRSKYFSKTLLDYPGRYSKIKVYVDVDDVSSSSSRAYEECPANGSQNQTCIKTNQNFFKINNRNKLIKLHQLRISNELEQGRELEEAK